jgi:mannose/fructose-specific phosphotransferase system component IIA
MFLLIDIFGGTIFKGFMFLLIDIFGGTTFEFCTTKNTINEIDCTILGLSISVKTEQPLRI